MPQGAPRPPGERVPLDPRASTSTTTGRPPASPARGRARSTTRRRPRPAATATCRSSRPTIRRRCDGLVRSHRFPGANTALPFVNGDAEQLRLVQDFLRDGQVSVDVFGITRVPEAPPPALAEARGTAEPRLSSTFAVGEESMRFGAAGISTGAPPAEVLAPLDLGAGRRAARRVRAGRGGRPDAQGGPFLPRRHRRRLRRLGGVRGGRRPGPRAAAQRRRRRTAGRGRSTPSAHFYRSLQLDERGNPINKRNAWMTRSVAYVRLIPPGAADTVHYRLAGAGRRRRPHLPARQGQLPQIRVVEHAVGLRRGAGIRRRPTRPSAAPTMTAAGRSPETPRTSRAASRRSPTSRRR